jgi:UDP-N-acetylmuramoyl-L-alanyl-D-glutamate--2,6-diaminopimelate ligase
MASMSRSLADLAGLVEGRVVGDETVAVRDVTHDSRQAGPGTLFVAIPGAIHDGHDYVSAAVAAGSPAVMLEREVDAAAAQLIVERTRPAMAPVAAEVYGHPSRRLSLIGVTGTNGKTTVTHMVEAIAASAGRCAGLIGTVHTRVGQTNIPNTRTTPESSDFQRLLASMVDLGADIVAAEVSSHALDMYRADATRFAVAAFTNLSQDHLDFHGDMERYFAAKARLFEPGRSEKAVVWVDDPAGRQLLDMLEIPVLTVGSGGELFATDISGDIAESRFRLHSPGGEADVRLPLGGGFNVDNALIAAGCALSLGVPIAAIADGLEGFSGVPGRFEVVSGDDPVRVVVDYAHTPAGIASAIATVRDLQTHHVEPGRVIVVFGAGGDRDRAKRGQMGSAAANADVVVVTSDNPRSEDPETIIDEVLGGVERPERFIRQSDRRQAIHTAIAMAAPGDVVLVLGRGHERGQEVGGRSFPFDDRQVTRETLAQSRGRP